MIFLSTTIFALFYFIARPAVRQWFPNWPLKGIPVGIIIGYALYSWLIWLFVNLGFPLNTGTAWSLLIFLSVVGFIGGGLKNLKDETPQFVVTYFSFLLFAALYISCRRYNADLTGLEKFPDLAFVTSAFKAVSLPPLDPFAAGERINYYYFGHFQAAVLTHLHGRLPFEYFHFQVANIFALTILALYSTGSFIFSWVVESSQRYSSMVAGSIAAFLGALSGNLQPIYEKWIAGKANYFYPTATRYIENVIHEFPFYSFVVGDLHGHLMNMPNAIIAVGLCPLLFDAAKKSEWNWRTIIRSPYVPPLFLIGFFAGLSYVTNAWDIMTTLLLAGFTLVAAAQSEKKLFTFNALRFIALSSAALVALAIILYLPYWAHFSPPSEGIAMVPPGKSSPVGQLLLIWGVHAPFALLFFLAPFSGPRRAFLKTLSLLGFGLILALEFFYMRDIYPTHFRANTMFKIGFQVWLWFSILGGIVITAMFDKVLGKMSTLTQIQKIVINNIAALLLLCGGYYTWLAPKQAFMQFNVQYTLDGRDFMRRTAPEDVNLIDWIHENLAGQPTIVEAAGDSFTEFGRISAFTGNPTIIQWSVHEWLWRGSFDRPFKPHSQLPPIYKDTVANRIEDVRSFYEAQASGFAQLVLKKYKADYFVIGRKEREKYSQLNEPLLKTLGKPVFIEGDVALYQVNR